MFDIFCCRTKHYTDNQIVNCIDTKARGGLKQYMNTAVTGFTWELISIFKLCEITRHCGNKHCFITFNIICYPLVL